jgi:hypothetical protein
MFKKKHYLDKLTYSFEALLPYITLGPYEALVSFQSHKFMNVTLLLVSVRNLKYGTEVASGGIYSSAASQNLVT